MTIHEPASPRMVRLGLLNLFVHAVARAAEHGDIGDAARRLALELARALTLRDDAIALDAVRDATFGHAPGDERSVELSNAFVELAQAGLVTTHATSTSLAPLRISSIELRVSMRGGRVVEHVHAWVARTTDLIDPRKVALCAKDAERVRARIAGRRGRVVELPAEVLGA